MSITYNQAQQLCNEVKARLVGSVCSGVTGLSSRTFLITFPKDNLRICLQEPFMRFHLDASSDMTSIQLPFVKGIAHTLHGMKLVDSSLLNEDRILALTFQKGDNRVQLVVEFFPRRPNCYLLNLQNEILFAFNSTDKNAYELPAKHAQVGNISETCTSASISKQYAILEDQEIFLQKHKQVQASVKKNIKRAENRLEERKAILQQCLDWEKIQHEAQLLQSNLFRMTKGMSQIQVADWNAEGNERIILLDPLLDPRIQVAKCFQRSKKLRKGVVHAERQMVLTLEEFDKQKNLLEPLKEIESLRELDKFCIAHHLKVETEKGKGKKPLDRKPYHVYTAENGTHIWVGKSAKDNDKLTFHCSKGSDWWLHAHNYPGSHVVISLPKGHEPEEAVIKDAAELALRFSKAKDMRGGEVCFTQVKFLKPVKASPGQVLVSKHKILKVDLDEQRWQRLKDSK